MKPVLSFGKLKGIAAILLFVAVILLPAAGALIGTAPSLLNEKRNLAEFPELQFTAASLAAFPEKFEAFVNDRFPFRDRLIRLNNLAKLRLLGISPHANVTLGKNDWLFLTYEQAAYTATPRKSRPFSPTELARCKEKIEADAKWAADRGIRYVLLITPDKQTIYPELYPRKRSIRLDQLHEFMGSSDVVFPDLREPLLRAKAERPVYFRTDSHWNDYGAHAAYECAAEAMRRWYPQLPIDPLSAFKTVGTATPPYAACYYGDLPSLLGFGDACKQYVEDYPYFDLATRPRRARKTDEVVVMDERQRLGGYYPYVTEQADQTLPRALVFHDSFGVRLAPLLSESFQRSVFVPCSAFDRELVERERPDVVIFQIVERKLEYFVAPDPDPVPNSR